MYNLTPVSKQFGNRLDEFKTKLSEQSEKRISYEIGTKYVKILSGPYGKQTLHCFLDFSGNIYKLRNEKAPAPKVLGSIYDEDFGLTLVSQLTGIDYVR